MKPADDDYVDHTKKQQKQQKQHLPSLGSSPLPLQTLFLPFVEQLSDGSGSGLEIRLSASKKHIARF